MDFLEHEGVDDVIVMKVVLDEVSHRNQSIYQRLRALAASPSKRFFVFGNENHRHAPTRKLFSASICGLFNIFNLEKPSRSHS